MTINEAIEHCREEMNKQMELGCTECAKEHFQLLEWLCELKVLRKLIKGNIALIKKDTGEVILSISGNSNEAIVYNDYELIDTPHLHDFVEIDGKIYLKTRCMMDLKEAEK